MCEAKREGGRRCAGYYRRQEILFWIDSSASAATTEDLMVAYRGTLNLVKTRGDFALVERAIRKDPGLFDDEREELLGTAEYVEREEDITVDVPEAERVQVVSDEIDEFADALTRAEADDPYLAWKAAKPAALTGPAVAAWKAAKPTPLEAEIARFGRAAMDKTWGIDHGKIAEMQRVDLELDRLAALEGIPGVGLMPRPTAKAGSVKGVSLTGATSGQHWRPESAVQVRWSGTGGTHARRRYVMALGNWFGRVSAALQARTSA